MTPSTFQYGANFKIIGKCDPEKLSYSGAFKPVRSDFAALAEHISKGYPWMPAILDGNRKRWQVNANYAEIIAADIDKGMTMEQATAHPFISAYCGLLVESASSKPEHHKFRLVFRFSQPLTGWETVRICNRYLINLLGAADPACKDASRFFFGAPGRSPVLLNESAVLPEKFVEDAISWYEAEEAKERQRAELARQQWEEWRRQNPDAGSEVADALRYIAPYTPGEGRYSSLIAMIGGVLSELGSEGEALLREWDGGRGQWGRGGFDRILQSLSGSATSRKATLGTLFYLAKQGGYQHPKREHSPGAKLKLEAKLEALRQQPDPEQDLAEVQAQEQQINTIQRFCEKVQRGANHFKRKLETALYGEAAKDFYRPGILSSGRRNVIVYRDDDDLIRLLREAHSEGIREILDSTPPGGGKSHTYSKLRLNLLDEEGEESIDSTTHKTWWLSHTATNPTTAPVEDRFERLPVRNAGMVADSTRKTPSGRNFLHHPKEGQLPNDNGNCHLAKKFHIAAGKGIGPATETASSNPICQNCEFGKLGPDNPMSCKHSEGDGFGFRYQRKEILASAPRIRTHAAQLAKDFDYTNSWFVADESEGQLSTLDTRIVTPNDLARGFFDLNPEAFRNLEPLRLALKAAETRLSEAYYGLDDTALREILPELPTNIDELIMSVDESQPRLDDLLREGQLENTPVQWIKLFLQVWAGQLPGVFRLERGGILHIKTESGHLNAVLDQSKLNVYLDATLSREKLAMLRHIHPDKILEIQRHQPPIGNLEVKHVHNFGLLGTQRSPELTERVSACLAELRKPHPDLAVIDRLSQKSTTGADGHWFSDFTRGTNEFQHRSAIALVGLPLMNVGVLSDLHQIHKTICEQRNLPCMTFDQFYREAIDGEIVQAVGRLRANRRPNEKLTVYILGDTEKSQSLDYSLPACLNAEVIKAEDICPEAADPARRAFLAVQQFVCEFSQRVNKLPTQEQVSKAIGLSQGYISKLAQNFVGGWKGLLAFVQGLIEPIPEPLPPTEAEQWAAENYVPEIIKDFRAGAVDIAAELNTMLETFGWRGWRRIVGAMNQSLRFELLTALLLPRRVTTADPCIGNRVMGVA